MAEPGSLGQSALAAWPPLADIRGGNPTVTGAVAKLRSTARAGNRYKHLSQRRRAVDPAHPAGAPGHFLTAPAAPVHWGKLRSPARRDPGGRWAGPNSVYQCPIPALV